MAKAPIVSNEYDHFKNSHNAYTEFCRKSALKTVIERAKKVVVRDWYLKTYPTDECGYDLLPELTFDDLISCLQYRNDVYAGFGISDSLVRERIFQKLTEIMKTDYDIIYYVWIG